MTSSATMGLVGVTRQDLVGPKEIAERLGITRAAVDRARTRKTMPEPDYTISGNPVWKWSTIARWAVKTGRLPR